MLRDSASNQSDISVITTTMLNNKQLQYLSSKNKQLLLMYLEWLLMLAGGWFCFMYLSSSSWNHWLTWACFSYGDGSKQKQASSLTHVAFSPLTVSWSPSTHWPKEAHMSQPRIREGRTTKLHGKGQGCEEEAISATDHIRFFLRIRK